MTSDRHSSPLQPSLIVDPDAQAEAEARNGLRQFDFVTETIESYTRTPDRPFKLRPSLVLSLHRIALEGISAYAGNFRPAGVEIVGSSHSPAGAHLVPELIEEMCDYVNENWQQESPIHLCAYVMWRLNWIHPFTDGNGRTSRALSYIVLSIKLGYRLPGLNTIPEQIASNKHPYYAALEKADDAFGRGCLDLKAMEDLLSDLLANQLVSTYTHATGSSV